MDNGDRSKRVFATMLTSESYLPGALTLLKSLKKHHQHIPVYCLSTLSPTSKAGKLLETQFDKVSIVSPIKFEENKENLKILGRPDLDLTLTKLHVFGLDNETVDQVVFLDADTLVLHPIAPAIFEYVDEAVFAAAPDIGWPDCFNSGVFATRPHPTLFSSILEYAKSNASFDGGDQGLLNSFFSTWAQRDSVLTSRLPFTFNVTPSPYYTYMPAFVHFARDLKIAHFIGPAKPWKWNRGKDGSVLNQKGASEQTLDLVAQWWRIFDEYSIEKLLDGFVLDRDWTRYAQLRASKHQVDEESATESQEKTPAPSAAPVVHDELSHDLDNYRVGWRSSELGPYRGNRSRSPNKKSHSPTKRDHGKLSTIAETKATSRTGNVLILSANRPPSPTRKLISTTSSKSAATPPAKKGSADGSIDDYVVGWNLEELKGVSTSETSGHPLDQQAVSPTTIEDKNNDNFKENPVDDSSSEKSVDASAVKRPVIKTDSFTITEKGKIIYK